MSEPPGPMEAARSLGYFRLFLRAFGDAPGRRAAILDGVGITEAQLGDDGVELTLAQQIRQLDNLNALLGPGWPFSTPDILSAGSHGPAGVAMITAPDLAAVLEVIARYGDIRAPFISRTLRRTEPAWSLELHPIWPLQPQQMTTVNELNLLAMRAALTAVLGRAPLGVRYQTTNPEPDYADRVCRILDAKVAFGAPVTAISVPTAALGQRPSSADPALHAAAIQALEHALQHQTAPDSMRERVERMLAEAPPGRMDADAIARALAVSRRTLVRRLAEARVNFRILLDAEMRRRATRLLDAGALSHAQIAEQLGYADATSFSRARRRWLAS